MTNIPSFETQLGWLTHEMGTGNGGNVSNTFYNNPNMTATQAAAAFERQYERSDTTSSAGQLAYQNRLNNASNIYSAIQNGRLTSYHPRVQQAYAHLKNQGYTDAQAAGIIGNLQQESGQTLNPNARNPGDGSDGSDSIGIAQWNSDRAANLRAYDPATGEVVPNTFVQEGDIDAATGEPLTAEQAAAVREEAQKNNDRRRQGSLYQENILNQFDNYTYNWAVHIHHPNLVGTYDDLGQIISDGRVITLSESGVENEISIDNVNQSLVLTFANENRNSVANLFTIDFIEAMGATFYTRIFEAARRLGIENHLEACYILELNFRGWNTDGSAVPVIIGPYFYQTKLTKLSMDFRDGASFYTGSFIETYEDAYARLNFHLAQAITISASNFGDFLTKFENDINQQARAQAIASAGMLFPNVYHFTTTDEYASWKSFVFDDLTDVEQTRGISVSISGGTLNITLPQGTSITSAISMVLFQTKQFKRIITNYGGYAKNAPADTEAQPERLADLVKWVSYETEVKYLTYDMLHKHYPKDITFKVKGYLTPEAIHDPASYYKSLNPDIQTNRLREIYDTGLLRKRFDYTYTGRNTEVLELDITLNNVFYTLQALSHGAVSMPAAFFNGIGGEQQAEVAALKATEQDLTKKLKETQNRVTSLRDENSKLISSPANASASNQALINRNRAEIDIANNQIKSLAGQAAQASQNVAVAQTYLMNNTSTNATSLPSTKNRYLTQDELIAPAEFNKYLPNNFDFSEVQSLSTIGPESPDNPGAAMLGAMEVNLNASGDLIQQSMVIRGDPYWLGRPNGFNNSETQADYNIGGVMYFLNIEFPTYPLETTGLSNNTRNFMLAGLYRVVKVNANYSNGKFTMTLNSFRDTNTDSESMYDNLIAGNVADSRIRNDPGNTNRDRQNETENNPDATDATGEGSDGAEAGPTGNNTSGQNQLASDVNPELNTILSQAAAASGVAVRTTSGLRTGEIGSGRHYSGDASDVALSVNGRELSAANPADRAIIATFTRNYKSIAESRGYTPSVGWADTSAPRSNWYMNGTHGHYDIAIGRSPHVSTNAATYWGNGSRSAGAPAWLKNIMTG